MSLSRSFVCILAAGLLATATAEAREPGCHPYFKLAKSVTKPTRHSKIARPGKVKSQLANEVPWTVADLCSAYQIPQNLTGTGVIGILELGGGWVQSDLDLFSQANGLPPIQVINISVDGTTNSPSSPPDPNSADLEVTLDIQVAAAAYFYATGSMPVIKVFFAENTYEAMASVINAAVDENCDVLSISWGDNEANWNQYAPGAAENLEATAKAAAAKGLVILAASGDLSSTDGNPSKSVDVPSSCPHIIGCGGTTKTSAAEVVWGDGVATDYGTGGGFSVLFPKQAFQLKAPPGSGRMVPDIAANADPATGYLMFYGGDEYQVGGTSAVAPLYAGFFAAAGRKLGFITPTLWNHPQAFTDITQGSNGDYSASTGPDPCTGLGVPHAGGVTGLFTNLGQTFSIKVVDRVAGNYSASLELNDPGQNEFTVVNSRSTGTGSFHQSSASVFSTVIGHSARRTSLLPGTFTAIVIDLKATGIPFVFDQSAAMIFGSGFGLNASNKFEIYSFTGQN